MKKKTFTDTALGIAPVVLLLAWVVTIFWVGDGRPWLRAANALVFFIAS